LPKINDQYDIGEAFEAIENELIASMIRNLRRHKQEEIDEKKQWSMWQAEQLKALEKYKKFNQKKYGQQFKDINKKIQTLISIARSEGEMDQEIAILEAIKKGFPAKRISKGAAAEFFKLNERKLEALIKATTDDMKKAETAVLRMANDQYRKIIYNAQVYANTGTGTYEKAVDMASKDFLSAGLNCVEYANGARHTISDYADMAIRTACKRAYLQGEGVKRQEWGIHTVIVNKRGNPCPKCLPFCGKVLIDDVWSGGSRKDGSYPLMSTAVAHGLYHPRCKDSHTTYFPRISTADDTWTKKELEAIGLKSKAEARRQYAERQEKRFGRLAEHSLDPENQKRYLQKERIWKHARFRTGNKDTSDYLDSQRNKTFFGIPADESASWKMPTKKEGAVSDLLEYVFNGEKFQVDGKRVLLDYSEHERKIAEIIAKESGKKVEMVPRVTFPQNVQTPDYLIDGMKFDLKTPTGNGKNTLYGMVKSKKRQANNFVICADQTILSMEDIEEQIRGIYSSTHTSFVDIIVLVRDEKIMKVYARKK